MDPYTFAAALGGAGLAAMAALGVSHLGGAQHQAHAGHDGAAHAGDGASLHGAHLPGHAHGTQAHVPALRAGARGGVRGSLRPALLSLVSPRVIFSAVLGFGITGLLFRPLIGGVVLAAAAVAGGVLFEAAVVRPIWNLLFRFASTPAASLEGSLLSEATATSGFDANGQGIVALEVDGQMVQCLGTLRAMDRDLGVRVRSGDVLRVEDVDPARNRCTVSYVRRGSDAR